MSNTTGFVKPHKALFCQVLTVDHTTKHLSQKLCTMTGYDIEPGNNVIWSGKMATLQAQGQLYQQSGA